MEDNKDLQNEEIKNEVNEEQIKEENSIEKTPSERMEDLAEAIEEEQEAQKELAYFKQMFFNYNNGKIQTIFSFVVMIGIYILKNVVFQVGGVMPLQMLFVFLGAMGLNAAIALFRCSLNKEIKEDIRKLSKKLSIYLFLAILCAVVVILMV